MKHESGINPTPTQMDRLLDDLRKTRMGASGGHLTDEEFTRYVLEELPADQTERIDAHLSICEACAAEAERLFEVSAAWMEAQGTIRLAALRQRIRISMLVAHLNEALAHLSLLPAPDGLHVSRRAAAVRADSNTPPVEGQTEDGRLRWFIEEDPDTKNLVVRIESPELDLAGLLIQVVAGNWEGNAILQQVSVDSVGTEIVVPLEERENVPGRTALQLCLLLPKADDPPAE